MNKELEEAADALLSAAMTYWKAFRRVNGGAAVVWVEDEDGRLVVLTRGEYRDTIMANIEPIRGPHMFDK